MPETYKDYFLELPKSSTKNHYYLATVLHSDNPPSKHQTSRYHQLIIPYGILFILILCLTTTSIEWNQSKFSDRSKYIEKLSNKNYLLLEMRRKAKLRRELISLKLLEHREKCYDLQIFTKQTNTFEIKKDLMDIDTISENFNGEGKGVAETDRRDDTNTRVLPDAVVRKRNISNKGRKSFNNKNKNNGKYIKSTRTKSFWKKNLHKKDILQKKASTADPIIYLFALVFIYLLLKAASDINQHYKSQTKGDKRLRRCSLQSYAQIHKPDRRASKSFSTKNILKL